MIEIFLLENTKIHFAKFYNQFANNLQLEQTNNQARLA